MATVGPGAAGRDSVMSWYELHRCVYDFIRSHESARPQDFQVSDYRLTAEERSAFDRRDVAALYRLDLHGVLLNRYCRQIGLSRQEYRSLLAPFASPESGRGRWQN